MRMEEFLLPRAANFRPLTPVDFLARSVEVFPDKTAVIFGDETLSYRQFGALVGRIAAALQARGIGRGDVVSAVIGNRPEMLALHYAVPLLGAVLNTINTRIDADTIAYILAHAETRFLFVEAAYADTALTAAATLAEPIAVSIVGGPPPAGSAIAFDALIAGVDPVAIDGSAITDESAPICLNYTSGTTGKPKGVVYHHRGAYLNAIGNVLALGFDARTTYLWILPMFHCNGWAHTWAVTAAGGTHVCLSRIDAGDIFREIARCEITHFSCAPVVLYMLLNAPEKALIDPGRRVCVATGGAAPTSALIAGLDRLGIHLVHLYGLTESYGPVALCMERDDWGEPTVEERARLLARQGVRHVMCERFEVLDPSGQAVPMDGATMGEIAIASNTLMSGYYKDADATEYAFRAGRFWTGDLAVRHPDGYVEIKDRAKDIIISGGENISSLEIESVLHQHPCVLMAAVVADPDEKWGEIPHAFIELKADEAAPSPEELTAFCRQRMAGFKIPRRFSFGELPKTATGKIQKFVLRDRARSGA